MSSPSDASLKNGLARLMIGGVLLSAGVILAGLLWFLWTHPTAQPGDHLFTGEPGYLDNPMSLLRRAFDPHDPGHIRCVVMVGIVLLLLNPLVRVIFSLTGYALRRDWLYAAISAIVFLVLLFSFFW